MKRGALFALVLVLAVSAFSAARADENKYADFGTKIPKYYDMQTRRWAYNAAHDRYRAALDDRRAAYNDPHVSALENYDKGPDGVEEGFMDKKDYDPPKDLMDFTKDGEKADSGAKPDGDQSAQEAGKEDSGNIGETAGQSLKPAMGAAPDSVSAEKK